jgi:CxxC motif-containing protein (DUF1111 family)
MTIKKTKSWWCVLVSAPIFLCGAATMQGPPPPGGPLPGLTPLQLQQFNDGRDSFLEVETVNTGLGPVFNGVSCVQCHRAFAPGGASADIGISRVTRIGAMVNGIYSDLTEVGGPLLQSRSLREFIPGYALPGEVIPPAAQFVARRITTPLFGDGLIEAIPAQTIINLSLQSQPDGIKGMVQRVLNPETNQIEVGRFGWKAQVSSLHWFAGDAYLNEMGITNPFNPHEVLPQGNATVRNADMVRDPEDPGGEVEALTDFMRFLAPPPRAQTLNQRGQELFGTMNCASCHTPTMQTGPNGIAALSNKPVNLYSDLLLHQMGPALADNIQQGKAAGDQFRTAPLWGVGKRPFWMHDGRATSIDQAIRMHGGEATAAANRYIQLIPQDRQAVIDFLLGI